MKVKDTFKYFCGMCWACFVFCTLVLIGVIAGGVFALVTGHLLFGLGALSLAALYGTVMSIIGVSQARFHYSNGVACFEI